MTPLTSHLTKEELTDNLLGVSSLTVNAHLLDCPTCAHELEQVKRTIGGFREAAHGWSEHAQAAEEIGVVRNLSRKERSRPARWILAAAAMILLVAGSVVYTHREPTVSQTHPITVVTPTTDTGLSRAQLDQDNQLLAQVSVELSEAVPAPMQPLVVSESSGSSATKNK